VNPVIRPKSCTISDERKGKWNGQRQAYRGADHWGAEAGGIPPQQAPAPGAVHQHARAAEVIDAHVTGGVRSAGAQCRRAVFRREVSEGVVDVVGGDAVHGLLHPLPETIIHVGRADSV